MTNSQEHGNRTDDACQESKSKNGAHKKPSELRQKARASASKPITVFGRPMRREELFRLGGLLAFFVLLVVVVALIWPYMGQFFDADGRARMIEEIRNAGPLGVLILLGVQVLQVVVAFIPGEVVQIAAGVMYGPVGGMVIVLVGCVIASAIVYQVVHRLGQPFVESMVPMKYMERFREFEAKGKLDPLVFILFLIPGLPKDTFTYLVPLTNMPLSRYLVLSTIARIPGVFMSTFASAGVMDGNIRQAVIAVVVLAVLAGVGYFFKDKIIGLLGKK